MNYSKKVTKKPLTFEQAYLKLATFCSFRDRTLKEVEKKMKLLELSEDLHQALLEKLLEERFIDEQRMAQSYAGSKFRSRAWGKHKIVLHMKHLGLSEQLIEEGLSQISEEAYDDKLQEIALKKWNALKDTDEQIKLSKTVRFLAGKGYESDKIWSVMKNITKKTPPLD
jgi:regulatory protein